MWHCYGVYSTLFYKSTSLLNLLLYWLSWDFLWNDTVGLQNFLYEIKMLPLICLFQSAAALRMRTNVGILGENKLWKNVYQRKSCPLVLNLLHVYRTWFMVFIYLLSPVAIVKKYILGTFIYIHLHVWFILDQYAVDRSNLTWIQRVHFISSRDVNTVRLIIFVELAFDEMVRWKRKTLPQAGKEDWVPLWH